MSASDLKQYENRPIRTVWDEEREEIRQRLLSIRVRNELTAEWQKRGVEQTKKPAAKCRFF